MSTRTSTLKFNFTGDSTKIVRAFEQLSAAARKSGGDLAAAGRQMEAALRNAEQAAARTQSGLAGALRTGATTKVGNLAAQFGIDQFADVEGALTGITTKQAVAAAGGLALGAALAKGAQLAAKTYLNTVEAVDAVGDAIGSSAQEASQIVGIFRGLGISADSGASALAKLAKNVTTNETQLRRYGVIIARTADGGVDMSTTLLNVASAYQAQTDPAIKAQVAAAAFGREWVTMVDLLETSRSKLQDFEGLAPSISDEDIAVVKEFKAVLGELKGQAEDTGSSLGGPLVGFATAKLNDLNTGIKAAGDLISGDFSGAWDHVTGRVRTAEPTFSRAAANMLSLALAGGSAVVPAMNEVATATERASAAAARFNSLFERQALAVGAQVKFRSAVAGLAQVHEQGTAAAQKYADASDNVAKAARDGARAVAEAQEDQQKTAVDGARRIAEAEARAADRIVQSEERIIEARRAAAESAQDDADRVEDARRALVDAATAASGNDNPFEAKRSIEDARIALARAERDATQNAEERARNVAEAEEELADTQQDAVKDVSEARREAAEADVEAAKRVADAQVQAAERVQSAQESLTGAVDTGTAAIANNIGKVDELVSATFDQAFQLREAGASQQVINDKVKEAKDALDLYKDSLGLTNDQVAYYKQLLDLIPLQVRSKITFTIETITNNARSLAVNAVAAAAANAIASQLQVPQFEGGGIFRTGKGGAGLAVLHDGERVLTPEEQAGGGAPTIVVQGSLVLERDLLSLIDRAQRRGFRP